MRRHLCQTAVGWFPVCASAYRAKPFLRFSSQRLSHEALRLQNPRLPLQHAGAHFVSLRARNGPANAARAHPSVRRAELRREASGASGSSIRRLQWRCSGTRVPERLPKRRDPVPILGKRPGSTFYYKEREAAFLLGASRGLVCSFFRATRPTERRNHECKSDSFVVVAAGATPPRSVVNSSLGLVGKAPTGSPTDVSTPFST